DVTIIVTDWSEFKDLKAEDYRKLMKKPIIVDTRRIYRERLEEFNERTVYIPIGIGKK
ncbi:MAG: UDP-glucose 6-dehydrogenase, partial [Thermoprotei archaeon]